MLLSVASHGMALNGSDCACDPIDSSPSDGRMVVYTAAMIDVPPSVLRDVGLLAGGTPTMDGADDDFVILRPLALWIMHSLGFPKFRRLPMATVTHLLSLPDGSLSLSCPPNPRGLAGT